MQLQGSCHCGAVRFRVESPHPTPYQRCYCSICRKTQGGGGFAINLGAEADSLEVEGHENVRFFHATLREEGRRPRKSSAVRTFCQHCGSGLWLYDERWPELVHPFASAIDTPLPTPPEHTHLMLGSKAPWVEVEAHPGDKQYDEYPEESIAAWHQRLGLTK